MIRSCELSSYDVYSALTCTPHPLSLCSRLHLHSLLCQHFSGTETLYYTFSLSSYNLCPRGQSLWCWYIRLRDVKNNSRRENYCVNVFRVALHKFTHEEFPSPLRVRSVRYQVPSVAADCPILCHNLSAPVLQGCRLKLPSLLVQSGPPNLVPAELRR